MVTKTFIEISFHNFLLGRLTDSHIILFSKLRLKQSFECLVLGNSSRFLLCEHIDHNPFESGLPNDWLLRILFHSFEHSFVGASQVFPQRCLDSFITVKRVQKLNQLPCWEVIMIRFVLIFFLFEEWVFLTQFWQRAPYVMPS